ncbi:MAG: glycine/sarcosine/betaine reductase selenoprotein B family protein [Hyphomicrobiaceae bacterium]
MAEGRGDEIPYMLRTRAYYRALGYDNDYVWAHFDDVPFTRPTKPLSEMRVALVTTAGPPDRSNRDAKGRKQVWFGDVSSPPATFDTDLAWDKESTHTDDRETFLPIDSMRRLVDRGVVGSLAPHFSGVPTDYSHAKTLTVDAPKILDRIRKDGADAALLTAL